MNVAVAAAAADAVAARIDGNRDWDEDNRKKASNGAVGVPAVALTAPGRELLAVSPRGEVIVASPPLERCPVGAPPLARRPRPATSRGSDAPEPIAWRHLATLGGFREEFSRAGGSRRWACVGSVAARGSFLHVAWCFDDARGDRPDAAAVSGLDAAPGKSAVTTYHLSTGAAVGTAPMPSLPPPRGSLPLADDVDVVVVDDDDTGRRRRRRRGLVVVAPGVGDFPEIIVTAYESGGTAGVFRLEQRVPASLAASIDAVINGPIINGSMINGSLINGSLIDGSPSAVRRAARTLRVLATECAGWGGSAEGARRRASLALAELEAIAAARGFELDLDDGDDDEGGGAVSAGGTLRAALLLRERDASSANAESWRSAAAKCVESVRSPASASSSLEAYVSSSADARVVEDALRDADAVDVEKYPSNDDDEVSGEISESKWKRLGTPASARRLDPTEWDDATWYDLDDDVPMHADARVGLAVMESAEASSAAAVPESKALDADDALLKCRNAIHLATQAARARTEPTAALSAGTMFDNHAAETVADLCDGSFDGGRRVREAGDAFDDAFALAIDHISRATIGAEERVANSRGGKTAHSTAHSDAHSDADPDRDYGVFESTCAVLHACWPRALPSFVRAYAFRRGISAKDVAALALRRLAPTKLELSDKAGGVSRVARACLLHVAGHTRVATWMLLTGVRCVNDPEAALNEMMERCARVYDAGEKEKEKSTRRPTLVRHSSEEDDSSDSSGDDDAGGDGAPMSARAFAAFGGSSIKPRARGSPGKELRATPLGWRLATELLRACASVDDVRATADVFDVLRASFTASAGAASAWSAQSPLSPQIQSQGQSQSQSQSPPSAPPPKCVDVAEDGLCTAEGAAAAFLAAAGVAARCWAGGAAAEAARAFQKLTDVDPNEGIDVRHDAPRPVTWERGRADALERLAGEAASRLREIAARVRT